MKQISLLLFWLFCTLFSNAKNYYVSASGDDSNDGLTINTPWQSLAKVNQSSFAAGDVILFKRGDSFYGTINVSNNNLTFDAYGTGALPVISGFTTLSSWTSVGGGVYQVSAPDVKNAVNMVVIDDVPQEVGRYPNADAPNGGYLTATGFSGTTEISADGLSGEVWTGAELVARKMSYIIERNRIASQSGNTLTYVQTIQTINPRNSSNQSPALPNSPGFGLFIQRDFKTLDKLGEWFYDSTTHLMSMYFGATNPDGYSIRASSFDTLINIGDHSGITINSLSLSGANLAAVFFHDGRDITITNCTITNSGAKAIFGWYSFNTFISSNTINYSLCSAIDVRGIASNVTITNNRIKNTALFQGMGSFYDPADANGIYVGVSTGARVSLNSIDSTGYNGIHFDGSNVNIDSNFVNYFCSNRNDGGGIYTFSTRNTNRKIRNNIVTNGVFAPLGTQEDTGAQGIYLDGGAQGVEILNNTIDALSGSAFAVFMNSPKDVLVRGNTAYNCNGWYVGRQYNEGMYNFSLKKNIIFNTQPTQLPVLHTHTGLNTTIGYVAGNIQQSLQQLGAVDSNYYNLLNPAGFSWYYANTFGGGFTFPPSVDLSSWQEYTGLDAHSVKLVTDKSILEYNATAVNKTVSLGSNIYRDVFGKTYSGNISLAPYSSVILINNGGVLANHPPVANAGVDKSIMLPVNTVTLTGSGTDADGSISSYAWNKISGPTGGTIVSANAASTALNNLLQGTYNLELTVTDDRGATARDTVKIVVSAATAVAIGSNKAPVVNAGSDKTVTLPANTVTLTGTATDPDGAVSSYLWTKIAGPAGGTITTAGAATTSVGNLVQGTYNFELMVTDNKGAKSKDVITVVVSAANNNKAPVANAGTDKTITLPVNTVTLQGSGTDADGTIAGYTWAKISGPAGGTIADSKAASTTISNLVKGAYNFVLTVTDNKGASSKDSVKVIVNAAVVTTTNPGANKAPVANAGTDKTVTLPINTVTLTGSGTDADGTIIGYTWAKISGPAGGTIATSNAASTTINSLVQGAYNFVLTVTDNKGAVSKDSVKVIVNAAAVTSPVANKAPVANAGADKTITLPANTVALGGSGTDTDGTISSYEWIKVAGPAGGAIGTTNASSTVITSLAKGIYKYALIVKDNKGLTGRDTVQITVNAALHSLAASAGTSKSVTLPRDTVSLVANVSVINAIVTSYSWTQIGGSAAIIENGNAAACLVKNLTKGNYTFELTVTDNAGGVAKDTISITVAEDPFLHRGSSLSVYPNPVKNTANLDLKTAAKDGTKIMVSVINSSGKVMSRKQFVSAGNNPVLKLDMTDLLDGFYIVNLIIENEQPLNAKVIKAR
ncbi:MAG: C-terminal target protein [Ferruginibacter sp.]|uniref:PKD domain-containing protein n=1 Tax=Ferruginibacter sp. TaxID=1940288 RepID=UPI002658DDC7|nr:right-handed parallel beta-helix repeat-containing protein [Ferruginibacter sp.]MDB5278073.1 C-terminal target protein [Ferruginibacter sp.]